MKKILIGISFFIGVALLTIFFLNKEYSVTIRPKLLEFSDFKENLMDVETKFVEETIIQYEGKYEGKDVKVWGHRQFFYKMSLYNYIRMYFHEDQMRTQGVHISFP